MMNPDSHASKRKSMQPKKRSLKKADEILSDAKKKKKKVEEVPIATPPLSEQKPKPQPVRISKDKPSGPENGNNSSSITPTSGTLASPHSNASSKVLLLMKISIVKINRKPDSKSL